MTNLWFILVFLDFNTGIVANAILEKKCLKNLKKGGLACQKREQKLKLRGLNIYIIGVSKATPADLRF
jgi:hypothetical protein